MKIFFVQKLYGMLLQFKTSEKHNLLGFGLWLPVCFPAKIIKYIYKFQQITVIIKTSSQALCIQVKYRTTNVARNDEICKYDKYVYICEYIYIYIYDIHIIYNI